MSEYVREYRQWTDKDGITHREPVIKAEDSPTGYVDQRGLIVPGPESQSKRTFDTGATRDVDDGKYDYDGFLAPEVLEAFAGYMHKHRVEKDGTLRDADNWKKGMPQEQYRKSLIRHVFDLWLLEKRDQEWLERPNGERVTLGDALGGILFNAMGYWYEELREHE